MRHRGLEFTPGVHRGHGDFGTRDINVGINRIYMIYNVTSLVDSTWAVGVDKEGKVFLTFSEGDLHLEMGKMKINQERSLRRSGHWRQRRTKIKWYSRSQRRHG